MEEAVKKAINFGIGAYKEFEENTQKAWQNVEKEVNELISKGASANDETSVQIKNFADEAAKNIQNVFGDSLDTLTNATADAKRKVESTVSGAQQSASKQSSSASSAS